MGPGAIIYILKSEITLVILSENKELAEARCGGFGEAEAGGPPGLQSLKGEMTGDKDVMYTG